MSESRITREASIASVEFSKEGEYWTKQLSGEWVKGVIPYDYAVAGARAALAPDLTGKIEGKITGDLFTRLMTLSNRYDYTLHMIAVAVVQVLLDRYRVDTESDMVIGSPIYRQGVNAEFVNTLLPIRTGIRPGMTFKELLLQVRQTILDGDKYKNFPMTALASRLNLDIKNVGFPFFDVGVMLTNIHDWHYWQMARLNMVFAFTRTLESLEMDIHFHVSAYERATVERIRQYYFTLMGALTADVNQPMDQAEMMDHEERQRLITQFNQPVRPGVPASVLNYPLDQSITDLFCQQVNQSEHRIAVISETNSGDMVSLSYGELKKQASRLAQRLVQQGAGPGDIVGVMVPRCLEMLVALMGILESGAGYLPISPGYPGERIAFMLKDSAIDLLVTSGLSEGDLEKVNTWDGLIIDINEIPDIKDQHKGGSGWEGKEPGTGTGKGNNLAYVIYTSGTTGNPKGVMVEHGNVINLVWGLRDVVYRETGEHVRVALIAPYVFDASVQQIFAALLLGHTLVIVGEETRGDGRKLAHFYHQHQIDVSDGVPVTLGLLLDGAGNTGLGSLPVRHFIIGGEALPQVLVQRFLGSFIPAQTRITNVYGPTECCVDSTFYRVAGENKPGAIVPIGQPMPNEQIYILNKKGKLQPAGAAGEIYISGHGVGRGYLNQPELTAEKWVYTRELCNGWTGNEKETQGKVVFTGDREGLVRKLVYKTGDLGRWLADGNIEFLGRMDKQVKIRGYRIELEEIENRLRRFGYEGGKSTGGEPGSFTGQPVIHHTHGEPIYCSRCVLNSNFPGISFDHEGVCNICREYETLAPYAQDYFQSMERFSQLVEQVKQKRQGDYDCLLLFSGGKDSSYVLYRLVEMGLKVLAFTFDNGYISATAFRNIQRITSSLGVDGVIGQTPLMPGIFVESLRKDHTVCTGCFKALTTISTQVAVSKNIPLVVTGLSRGQIFDTKLYGLYRNGVFSTPQVEEQLLLFRKVYHVSHDRMSRLLKAYMVADEPGEKVWELPVDGFAEKVFQDIQFVDYFRYDDVSVHQVKQYLESRDILWQQPGDTGFCSTNCLINDVGIDCFTRRMGFHNYAAPLSWDCRMGKTSRESALAEIKYQPDPVKVEVILKEIGFYERLVRDVCVVDREDKNGERYLCAYIVVSKVEEGEQGFLGKELKEYLARFMPDYMIPGHFIFLEQLPLTVNGKVDRRRLPEPKFQASEYYVAPGTDIEKVISMVWAEVLGLERVGLHDHFFDLGGNSLGIVKVCHLLQERLNREVPNNLVFLYPTVALLARHLGGGNKEEEVSKIHIEAERMESIEAGRHRLKSRLKRVKE